MATTHIPEPLLQLWQALCGHLLRITLCPMERVAGTTLQSHRLFKVVNVVRSCTVGILDLRNKKWAFRISYGKPDGFIGVKLWRQSKDASLVKMLGQFEMFLKKQSL